MPRASTPTRRPPSGRRLKMSTQTTTWAHTNGAPLGKRPFAWCATRCGRWRVPWLPPRRSGASGTGAVTGQADPIAARLFNRLSRLESYWR